MVTVGMTAWASASAPAGVIVDHQPHPTGGPAADTQFLNMSGQASWQLLADNVRLANGATITQIVWWGFYDQDNPPQTETMRVTLYAPRADGLPGSVISQEMLASFSRVWTGRIIPVTIGPREYRYQADLSMPLALASDTSYWIEIVQVGDLSTAFRWEYSLAERDGFAGANPIVPDWHLSTLPADLAFQLVGVPEPSSIALIAFGLTLVGGGRPRRIYAPRARHVGEQ